MKVDMSCHTLFTSQVVAGLLDDQEDEVRAGVSGMDWLEKLSDSDSSILSKIDWAAIERMVAADDALWPAWAFRRLEYIEEKKTKIILIYY